MVHTRHPPFPLIENQRKLKSKKQILTISKSCGRRRQALAPTQGQTAHACSSQAPSQQPFPLHPTPLHPTPLPPEGVGSSLQRQVETLGQACLRGAATGRVDATVDDAGQRAEPAAAGPSGTGLGGRGRFDGVGNRCFVAGPGKSVVVRRSSGVRDIFE